MNLSEALALARGDVVAFIGAGGKTSLMVNLGYELAEAGWRVLATTTTQLAAEQMSLFPRVMSSTADANAISQALSEDHFVFLHDGMRHGRVFGPPRDWTRDLLDSVDSDVLLVEADDAAGLPFKAPRADEPRIPPETTLVVSVASLSALGVPLDAEHIYNPEAMVERFGFVENSPVKSPWLAQVLRDDALGLQGVPDSARVMIFLNRTPERGYVRGRARLIARLSLQSERISAVALGSIRGAEPVSEVQRPLGALVFAGLLGPAGDGQLPQRSIDGGGQIVSRNVEQLMRSRIDHIRVVTGAGAPTIRAAVKRLGIRTAHNRGFRTGGVISALKTGLRALPEHVAAFMLVPGASAGLTAKLIYLIRNAYARGAGDFIVPRAGNQSVGPVLISRPILSEIVKLPRKTDWHDIIDHFAPRITFLDIAADGGLTVAPYADDKGGLRLDGRLWTGGH